MGGRRYTVGDKLFEEFGIPDAFKSVARGRANNKVEDEASTLVRITDKPSGVKILVIGDPRGEALTKLQAELGAARFGEIIFEGVTVLNGNQHHNTGVLEDPKDLAGLERLLTTRPIASSWALRGCGTSGKARRSSARHPAMTPGSCS